MNKTALKKKKPKIVFILILFFLCFGYIAANYSTHSSHNADRALSNPIFEIYPEDTETDVPILPGVKHKRPKVAIIIDDIGYDTSILKKFLDLDATFSYSVLPFSPYQKQSIGKLLARGCEIMMHLPMEPAEYPEVNPGPGALLCSMSAGELERRLLTNLKGFAYVGGVNNHMGSKMTTVHGNMVQIFSTLKNHDLFFVDSFTTSGSVCRSAARVMQIPFAKRDIFIDNSQDPEDIRNQIYLLLEFAESYGEAIGIGHPYRATLNTLSEMLPEIRSRVEMVPASAIVHIIG